MSNHRSQFAQEFRAILSVYMYIYVYTDKFYLYPFSVVMVVVVMVLKHIFLKKTPNITKDLNFVEQNNGR